MFLEYFVTALWATSLIVSIISGIAELFINKQINIIDWSTLRPSMATLFIAFFFQLSISLFIDNCYEKGVFKYAFSYIWYPWWYWSLNTITLLIGIPKAIFRNKAKLAVWTSPDRGV